MGTRRLRGGMAIKPTDTDPFALLRRRMAQSIRAEVEARTRVWVFRTIVLAGILLLVAILVVAWLQAELKAQRWEAHSLRLEIQTLAIELDQSADSAKASELSDRLAALRLRLADMAEPGTLGGRPAATLTLNGGQVATANTDPIPMAPASLTSRRTVVWPPPEPEKPERSSPPRPTTTVLAVGRAPILDADLAEPSVSPPVHAPASVADDVEVTALASAFVDPEPVGPASEPTPASTRAVEPAAATAAPSRAVSDRGPVPETEGASVPPAPQGLSLPRSRPDDVPDAAIAAALKAKRFSGPPPIRPKPPVTAAIRRQVATTRQAVESGTRPDPVSDAKPASEKPSGRSRPPARARPAQPPPVDEDQIARGQRIEVVRAEGAERLVARLNAAGFDAVLDGTKPRNRTYFPNSTVEGMRIATSLPASVAAALVRIVREEWPFLRYVYLDERSAVPGTFVGTRSSVARQHFRAMADSGFDRLAAADMDRERMHDFIRSFALRR